MSYRNKMEILILSSPGLYFSFCKQLSLIMAYRYECMRMVIGRGGDLFEVLILYFETY